MGRDIHAAAGVWVRGDKTCYFMKSQSVKHYPNTWSLPWQQHEPKFLDDPSRTRRIDLVMQQLSNEQFHGAKIEVGEFICEGSSDQNPTGVTVHFKLYHIELKKDPILNRNFHRAMAWMTIDELKMETHGIESEFCVKLWLEKNQNKI